MSKLNIYTDGASRGNPGPAGIGVVILDDSNNCQARIADYIGRATNNEAEYQAIITALEAAVNYEVDEIDLYSDSQLVVKQVTGEYQVRSEKLKPYYQQIKKLLSQLSDCRFHHLPREENQEADKLANRGIDEHNLSAEGNDTAKVIERLDRRLASFEATPQLADKIAAVQTKLSKVDLEEEELIEQSIIYGLLLGEEIN
ncbi:MAG: ribonuclease HI family protein [Bacillota bacterium]